MSGRKSLRYNSVTDMPPAMQAMLKRHDARVAIGIDHSKTRDSCVEALVVHQHGQMTISSIAETRRNKYGNQVTYVDGIRFDSKREAAYYQQLKLRKHLGEVSHWLRQVPIHLPCGTRYVIDFLVFFTDGRTPEYVDVKGRETKEFKIKKRGVEHHYPIRITLA